jgi:hypothetical protein
VLFSNLDYHTSCSLFFQKSLGRRYMCHLNTYPPRPMFSLLPKLSFRSRIYCLTLPCEQPRTPITQRPLPLCAFSSSKSTRKDAHVPPKNLPCKDLCALFFRSHTRIIECPIPSPTFTYYARSRDFRKVTTISFMFLFPKLPIRR